MATQNAIDTSYPIEVAAGGTGNTTLTDHGVLVGAGIGAVTSLAGATNGQLIIGSTGADPALAALASADSTVTITNGAGTIDLATSATVDSFTGFASWDGAGPYYDDTTLGEFTISQSGTGYIQGVKVTWAAPQTVNGLVAGSTYYIYIDNTGTIGATDTDSEALSQNTIVLFEMLRDSTPVTNNQVTVKENHSYKMPYKTSYYLCESIGTLIDNDSNGANITLNGTQKIEIVGEDILSDHGLTTTIPDSAGVAVVWLQYYTTAGGKWAQYASSDTFTGYYNNAGTPTALAAAKYAVYTLYASKDSLNAATPTYIAVLDNAEHNNLAAADTAISNGSTAKATAELQQLELARLGYIIYSEASSSIVDVIIDKQTLRATSSTSGANQASLILANITSFDGILSAADTTVQNALETIDDWGKTTIQYALLVGAGTGSPLASLAVGATGEMLVGNTGANPSWSTTGALKTLNAITVNATTFDTNVAAAGVTLVGTTLSADGTDADIDINITAKGTGQVIIDDLQLTTDLAVTEGGTGASTLTDHSVLVGSGTGAITPLTVGTNGQVLVGSTNADPVFATISDGTGITTTTGAGTLTIASTGTTLNDQTGTTYTLVLGDAGKFITFTNAAAITVTVPTNASVAFPIGTVIGFQQGGAGQVTFSGAVPPTLKSADNAYTTVKLYSVGCLVKIASDVWALGGDLEA